MSFLLFNRSGFISRWISGAFTFADPFVVSGEPAAGFDLAACRSFVALRRRFLVRRSFFHDFKNDNAQITPNIRDREKRFIGYKYYDQSTLAAYQRIQSEAIPSLGIYQAEPVSREIQFLGIAHNSVYFKLENSITICAKSQSLRNKNKLSCKVSNTI
ncbi:hypothetical protein OM428_10930 [Enterococcus gallinarum]|nr:hypothetical protein [Enterococcus gallinarum]